MTATRGAGATPRTRVSYVLGAFRSGTTVLDQLLGELEGFFSAGELRYFWDRGMLHGEACACGDPIPSCRVWSAVWREMDREPAGAPDPARVVAWRGEAMRVRRTWRVLRAGRLSRLDEATVGYADAARRLYRAVAAVTGARVIVDSSKMPSDAALLGLLPGIQPSFVHLVRDPRAVAHSWRRVKADPGRKTARLPRWGGLKAATSWMQFNMAAEAVRRRHAAVSMLLRYEDFVRAPAEAVAAVADLAGEPAGDLPVDDRGMARIGVNHSVAGNPGRFRAGPTPIREDDEWKRAPDGGRAVPTIVTLPMLRRYRYPLRVR